MPIHQRVAQALLEIDAVKFDPDNPIRFKSGILSPVYVDNRSFPYYPPQWRIIIDGLCKSIEESNIEYDLIAGVALGGVPHAAALAHAAGKPMVIIRKETKEYGTQKLIEGGDVTAKRVLLIEDMITTGSSSLFAVNVLRQSGAVVADLLAIVSYGFDEAAQAFAAAHVRAHTLTNFAAILAVVAEQERFDESQRRIIEDWLRDPRGWENKRDG